MGTKRERLSSTILLIVRVTLTPLSFPRTSGMNGLIADVLNRQGNCNRLQWEFISTLTAFFNVRIVSLYFYWYWAYLTFACIFV